MKSMITVSEAKQLVRANAARLPATSLSLDEAAGSVLAADVHALYDIPAYDQSSMDGYAFRFSDWHPGEQLLIEGEMQAGQDLPLTLAQGRTARIFTGAPVPKGADTVIMQEKALVENNRLTIQDKTLTEGSYVRPKGSEIRAGDLALPAGSRLTPAAIGFLAGLGLKKVSVYPRPRISILVTGKELAEPGQPLGFGKVYESNSHTLAAALDQLHVKAVHTASIDDDLLLLQAAMGDALEKSDILLVTGGASVGDYDFLSGAASRCGITTVFHKVKQRPGKPLFVGKKDDRLVFGLPGNPASVLTCFYEYVIPALEELTGLRQLIQSMLLPLGIAWEKSAGLTHFLKASWSAEGVVPLDAQESYRMHSFARANCLICLKEEDTSFRAGDLVEVHLLPG
jgi:molybdopterin molybdotransferase